ncbi:isocitrate lyase [Endozoicomonas sp. OPT23]|uniref:isocitrate lyase n=1 Tax=Endozoicomonas sp. OPT23 TaxID=2072845 RepID=UPI00129A8353|nr:isocitrate lyase [Endozoicomonas sp. OPT23]MRI34358.1 isocitrate lyase [Endozoicomonas sp. OPT23]
MTHYNIAEEIARIEQDWKENPRWKNVARPYSAADVVRLRGSIKVENTLARMGAEKLWDLLYNNTSRKGYVNALGAVTGGQAIQQIKAGIEAVYLSGWQVAADSNSAGAMYPDQSLYPVDSVPNLIKKMNNSMRRADQIQSKCGHVAGTEGFIDMFAPILADGEDGFGSVRNTYELMTNMIAAGVAGVHFEDQLASVKKNGHMGGKVLLPTSEAVDKLVSARLAADVADVPTLVMAKTEACVADLITSDIDEYDHRFMTGERTREGFYRTNKGIDKAIARGLAYSPYADLLWFESATPDLDEARTFAEAIHREYPNQLLAYNCSSSFNWKKNMDDRAIARFQDELSKMGYKFQFVTLAGIHSMWGNMFELAHSYAQGEGMKHYAELVQAKEYAAEEQGYTFTNPQKEVGTGYFDHITHVIQKGR